MHKCSITMCTVVLDTDQDRLQSNGSYKMVDYVAIVHVYGYTAMRTLCHEHLLSSFGYFRSDTTDLPLQSPVRAGQWRQCALQDVVFRHRTYIHVQYLHCRASPDWRPAHCLHCPAPTGDQHTASTAPPRLEASTPLETPIRFTPLQHQHQHLLLLIMSTTTN